MSADDDGHAPETCTYFKCDAVSDVPCPFLATPKVEQAISEPECKHEWRQYWIVDGTMAIPEGWFCVFCKLVE